jgi:hypothetical protein
MLPEASLISIAYPPGPDPVLPSGVRIPLPIRRVFIGRHGPAEGVHLTLTAISVSRYHACLQANRSGWWLRDLNSRNGTYVNREPVSAYGEQRLTDGDVISICDHRFLFATGAFDRRWLTSDVVPLARGILDDGAWDRLGILGDALLDAGCDWPLLLDCCSRTDHPPADHLPVLCLLREAGEFGPVPSPLVVDVNHAARPAFLGPPGMELLMQPGRV